MVCKMRSAMDAAVGPVTVWQVRLKSLGLCHLHHFSVWLLLLAELRAGTRRVTTLLNLLTEKTLANASKSRRCSGVGVWYGPHRHHRRNRRSTNVLFLTGSRECFLAFVFFSLSFAMSSTTVPRSRDPLCIEPSSVSLITFHISPSPDPDSLIHPRWSRLFLLLFPLCQLRSPPLVPLIYLTFIFFHWSNLLLPSTAGYSSDLFLFKNNDLILIKTRFHFEKNNPSRIAFSE